MSEKRFSKLSSSIDYFDVWDSVEEKGYTVDEVVELLNEQQATIRRLQDLCGESDSGNAKLRIENKKLKEENEQLRNELTFLNKVISFFADNPMTKYSSKSELLEEMKLLEEMGLI